MIYVLDTHAIVWHLANDRRLGTAARHALADETSRLLVPTIVLAELKHLAETTRVPMSFDQILARP